MRFSQFFHWYKSLVLLIFLLKIGCTTWNWNLKAFPRWEGKTKNSSHLSDYHLFIYLTKFIFIYFFTFRYCKNKSLRLSDTVSLKYKNAKYITDQQQQLTLNILRFIKKVHTIYLSYSAYFIIKEAIISRLC